MRIDDVRHDVGRSRSRLSATVTWEESEREPLEVFFETEEPFRGDLTCDPHAFLVACVPPALRAGERRIAIDADLSPELADGLQTAMMLLQRWSGRRAAPLRIEARSTSRSASPRADVRAGSFLSGGIDSLATLRVNRQTYPRDHPRSISDCLVIHGFDIDVEDVAGFQLALSALEKIAVDADVTLIPVRTNVQHLDVDWSFWMRESHGAALASVAHALSGRLSSATIASTFDLSRLPPLWGSHPLLDPCYGSAGLTIHHDGIRHPRIEKARIVAGWDVAFQHLRVCTRRSHPGVLNCGRCEKCIRTMLVLLAIGKLAECGAFEADDVRPSAVSGLTIRNEQNARTHRMMIDPLRAIGRTDLADVLERKVRSYDAWQAGHGWRGALLRFDGDGTSDVVRRIRAFDGTRDWRKAARRRLTRRAIG